MDTLDQGTQENTPRTRNRVYDKTFRLKKHRDGSNVDSDDWTERKEIEKIYRDIGFRSRKFSHKKEPEYRRADALLLSWTNDGASSGHVVGDIEIKVTFLPNVTVYELSYNGKRARSCINKNLGSTKFKVYDSEVLDVLNYVKYLIASSVHPQMP